VIKEDAVPTRILIADDDFAIRRLLRRIIEEHSDWEVCGEAVNGNDAVSKARDVAPDLMIVDLAMPQMNGLEAARAICNGSPPFPMLLLTVQEVSPELAKEARSSGFRGAVSKSTGIEIVKGIETLLRGEYFFNLAASDVAAS
jgi:DNA-binding NarL/FixJ family response regulator